MNSLTTAVNQWNAFHPDQILAAGDVKKNKQAGLGQTLFFAFNSATGWQVKELGYGSLVLAFFARIARYLHIAYNDTRLDWNLRQTDWINRPKKPENHLENPSVEFSNFCKLIPLPKEEPPRQESPLPKLEPTRQESPKPKINWVDPRTPVPASIPATLSEISEETDLFLKKIPTLTKESRAEFFDKKNEQNRLDLLNELNSIRGKFIKKTIDQNIKKEEREKYLKEINKLELAASEIIKILYSKKSPFGKHAINLAEFPSDQASKYFKKDGTIENLHESHVTIDDNLKLTQHPALNQAEEDNFLCGYYALFFFLQSIDGKDFNDRTAFKKYQSEWSRLIMQKRALSFLHTVKGEIAPFLEVALGPIGLSIGEIEFLLRNTDHSINLPWRIIELDNLYNDEGSTWALDPIAVASSPEKISADTSVKLIVKLFDHYFFMQAKMNNGKIELDCAHSLSDQVPGELFTLLQISDLAEKVVRKLYA